MVQTQLTDKQNLFLSFFQNELLMRQTFYFTGGTCLSEYYLHHRFSEDLDFFSERSFEVQDIMGLLNVKKKAFGAPKLDFQQSFNRNIFYLRYSDKEILKVEFTYFPFKRIDETKRIGRISIDSLQDIAVNKLFTIYQNPRGRDFFDLYFILKKNKDWSLFSLSKLARIKFDFHIDYLQLGSNLMKVVAMKDDPILTKKIDVGEIENFIFNEAKKLKDIILKKE